jgi:hypothetical protein
MGILDSIFMVATIIATIVGTTIYWIGGMAWAVIPLAPMPFMLPFSIYHSLCHG